MEMASAGPGRSGPGPRNRSRRPRPRTKVPKGSWLAGRSGRTLPPGELAAQVSIDRGSFPCRQPEPTQHLPAHEQLAFHKGATLLADRSRVRLGSVDFLQLIVEFALLFQAVERF